MAAIRYLLKPRRPTTFSLAMKIDYLRNKCDVTQHWQKLVTFYSTFLSLSLPFSLSYYSSLHSLFVSLTCCWYKASNPVVTTRKYSKFCICSSPVTSLVSHLLIC